MEQAGTEVTLYLGQYRHGWVGLCFLLMIIDTAYLGFRTLLGRDTGEPFGIFITQRVGISILLVVTGLVDHLLPAIPLLYAASLFYSGVFLLHIVKQVRDEGVKDLPPGLKERAEEMHQGGRSGRTESGNREPQGTDQGSGGIPEKRPDGEVG